jgi:hypothetical protein
MSFKPSLRHLHFNHVFIESASDTSHYEISFLYFSRLRKVPYFMDVAKALRVSSETIHFRSHIKNYMNVV